MPRKTPKPRKAGPKPLSDPKNHRRQRPDPLGGRSPQGPHSLTRQRRDAKRPPRFPGRQGGR